MSIWSTYAALGAAPASGDLLLLADVSDTSMAASGTTKRMTVANLYDGLLASANTFTAQNTFAMGTITDSKPLTYTATWNDGAETMKAVLVNVTDTASASASLLADFQVGGTTMASIVKSGAILSGTNGSASAVSFGRTSNTNTGMFFPGGNSVAFSANGTQVLSGSSTDVSATSSQKWAGIRIKVTASTAGSGAPASLDASSDMYSVRTNEGATAENYNTLPTAVAGYQVFVACQDSDGIRITAASGDTIRHGATVSATAGYIRSSTVGSTLHLVAINATEWFVQSYTGTWTIDS